MLVSSPVQRDNVYTVLNPRKLLQCDTVSVLRTLKPVSKGRKSALASFWVPVPLEGLRPSQVIAEFPGEVEICDREQEP